MITDVISKYAALEKFKRGFLNFKGGGLIKPSKVPRNLFFGYFG
jgi:hypothetical protein